MTSNQQTPSNQYWENITLEQEAQRAEDMYPIYMNDIYCARVINEGKSKLDLTSKISWENYN